MQLAALLTGLALLSGPSPNALRPPWLWSVEERIQARTDEGQRRARVAEAQARYGDQKQNRDVIEGSLHPELFLPTEVFQELVREGYVGDLWRDVDEAPIAAAGLPADFWDQLQTVSGPFITDLQDTYAVLTDKTLTRDEAANKSSAIYPTLCAHRADALAAARKLFGPAFDRLLYQYIAPRMGSGSSTPPTADQLRERERGCR